MSDKVRWSSNGPMEIALRSLFAQGDVGDEDAAATVWKKYVHLWPGITKDNFRRHFNRIKKQYVNYDFSPPKKTHATDKSKGKA